MGMIAVTGASGHIGANLVRELLHRGEEVRVVVRSSSEALEGLDVECVRGDVRDTRSLERAFDGAEVVYHLAAMISIFGDPSGAVRDVNVNGAENAARAALHCGVRRFVHCCSVHAFRLGTSGGVIDEQSERVVDDPRMSNAYDRSKAAGEAKIRDVVRDGLDAVIVHPTGVIGPWDFGPSRMGQVLLNLYHRTLPGLVAGGFDFVDVGDVVQGMIAAADSEKGRRGHSYLLSGSYRTLSEIASIAEEITGKCAPRIKSPMWLARMGAPVMEVVAKMTGDEPLYTRESLQALRASKHMDNSKARRELGFIPRPTHESVEAAYRWFAEHGSLSRAACFADGRPMIAR